MKRFPNADGSEFVLFERGDRVRVQRKGLDFEGTVLRRNDTMVSQRAPYYEIEGAMGWVWHEEVSEVPS